MGDQMEWRCHELDRVTLVMLLKQKHFPEGKMPRESGEVRPPRVAARKKESKNRVRLSLYYFSRNTKALHNLNSIPNSKSKFKPRSPNSNPI